MKLRFILPSAAALLMLASCGSTPSAKPLSSISGADASDSLAYYVGMQAANSYKLAAAADTSLASDEAREQFLKGMAEGIRLVKDNEAYNQGLTMGLQTGLGIRDHETRYGVDLKPEVYLNGLAYGLANPDSLKQGEINRYIQLSMAKAEKERLNKVKLQNAERLAKVAKDNDCKLYEEGFYSKMVNPGDGKTYVKGDKIEISFDTQELDGETINTPFLNTKELVVGVSQPGSPLEAVIEKMSPGAEAVVYTNAVSMFENNYERFVGDEPGMVIKLTIKTGKVLESGLDYNQIRANQEALLNRASMQN